jgi:hypothetical protein
MKNKIAGGAQRLAAALLAFGLTSAAVSAAAEEPSAASFIEPSPDKQCDQFNRSWVVASRHTYLSIKVRVKWSATGAKELEEEFVLSPGASRALGCGSKLEIVSAEIMQF